MIFINKLILLSVLSAQTADPGPGMHWMSEQWYDAGGNNSMNFDDDLVIKVYSDCNRYVIYNTGSGDINVTGTYAISADTEWDDDIKVRGIIEIEDDATLTITNEAEIQFADSKADQIPTYILVKRGGRLIIEDGAKLTGNIECSTMWEGIYVEGTYGTNHPTPNSLFNSGYFVSDDAHGIVKITGEATIQNARVGVSLGLPSSWDDYPDFGGGIIIADDANFINNTIDVLFWPFNKNNVSFIRRNDFVTNAALLDDIEVPTAHVEMIAVKNLNIRANNFQNSTSSSVYNGTDRGIGILSLNATYTADDNPNGFAATGGTSSDPNYFTDLYFGVYSAEYITLSDNIVIEGNIFDENGKGIYLGGTSMAEVNRNTLILPEKSIYGIYLDGSTGYGVEENSITGSGADHPALQSGIAINESGTADNWIYRNSFSSLKYGVRIQGNNGNTTNGLEIKCNVFEEGKYDIALISGTTTATMKLNQGVCGTETSPANNLFTDPEFEAVDTQIKTSGDISTSNYYKYSFHRDLFPGDAPFTAPAIYSNSIDPKLDGDADEFGCEEFAFDVNEREDYCPTNLSSGGGGGRMQNPDQARPEIGLMMDLNYNPYEYAKTEGEDYEEFLATIRFNMLASYYMQNNFNDSLFELVETGTSLLAKSIFAQIAIDSSDFEEAAEINDEIGESEFAEVEGFDSPVFDIALELSSDTLTWFNLSNEQKDIVRELAQQQDREGIQAKLLLEQLDGINYEEPINELNEEISEEELRLLQSTYPPSEINTINIYPHPVSAGSIVEIHLDRVEGNTRFIVTDQWGRFVLQFPVDNNLTYIKLDNALLKPGAYIGYITCHGCDKLSKQIIVVK